MIARKGIHWVVFNLRTRHIYLRTWHESSANRHADHGHRGQGLVGKSAACPCWAFWWKKKPKARCAMDDDGELHVEPCEHGENEKTAMELR